MWGRNAGSIPAPVSRTVSSKNSSRRREHDRHLAPRRRELDGVRQQVPGDLLQAVGVADGHRRARLDVELEVDLPRRGHGGDGVAGGLQHLHQVDRAHLDVELAGHDPRHVEDVLDELVLELRVAVDGLDGPRAGRLVELARAQHVRPSHDGGERRAQLVGQQGQELVLGAADVLRLLEELRALLVGPPPLGDVAGKDVEGAGVPHLHHGDGELQRHARPVLALPLDLGALVHRRRLAGGEEALHVPVVLLPRLGAQDDLPEPLPERLRGRPPEGLLGLGVPVGDRRPPRRWTPRRPARRRGAARTWASLSRRAASRRRNAISRWVRHAQVQLALGEGLDEEVGGARLQGAQPVGFLGEAGDDDDGHGARPRRRPQLAGELEAVDPREDQVGEDEVGGIPPRELQGLAAVARHLDVPVVGEEQLQDAAHPGVVFDDQEAGAPRAAVLASLVLHGRRLCHSPSVGQPVRNPCSIIIVHPMPPRRRSRPFHGARPRPGPPGARGGRGADRRRGGGRGGGGGGGLQPARRGPSIPPRTRRSSPCARPRPPSETTGFRTPPCT